MAKPVLMRESKKTAFPAMLQRNKGMITKTCQEMEMTKSTYYYWREKDEDFAARCDDVLEFTLDTVELALLDKIDKGDTTAMIFYLKTKGKHRGYVERIEQTGKDGEPLNAPKFTETDKEIINRAIEHEIEKRKNDKDERDGAESTERIH